MEWDQEGRSGVKLSKFGSEWSVVERNGGEGVGEWSDSVTLTDSLAHSLTQSLASLAYLLTL